MKGENDIFLFQGLCTLNFADLYVVNLFHLNCSFKQNKPWKLTLSLNLKLVYPFTPWPRFRFWKFTVDTGCCFHFFSFFLSFFLSFFFQEANGRESNPDRSSSSILIASKCFIINILNINCFSCYFPFWFFFLTTRF